MKLRVFCVRDVKTGQFGNPMFLIADGQATRSFIDEVNRAEKDNQLYQHPEDFDLFSLGSYDTELGTFDCHAPSVILTGSQAAVRS